MRQESTRKCCIDCGAHVTFYAKRCRACRDIYDAQRSDRQCIDCGKKLRYNTKRCRPCMVIWQRGQRKCARSPEANPHDPSGKTLIVPLTQGKFAIIDANSAETISAYTWHATRVKRCWYARTSVWLDGKKTAIWMHRLLRGFPDAMVDHWDGDGLNNRIENLRCATPGQNSSNSTPRSPIGLKGAYRAKSGGWLSCITHDGQYRYLGRFATPEEAARAYDEAAREIHGEFARCNFSD